jgi:Domain of unknown function (DUF4389)
VSAFPYYTTPTTQGPLPVEVAAAGPAPQDRATVFFRLILAIPHYFVLYFLGIAAGIVLLIGWWAALFTGWLPDFAATFLTGYIRWYTRVTAYTMLLTDVYPPFSLEDEPYPVRIAVPQPDRLNPLAVFFRIILVIPAAIVRGVVMLGGGTIVAFIGWLSTLISGELPDSLHLAYTAVLRYSTRLDCYFYLLTAAYPEGLFGDGTVAPGYAGAPPNAGYGAGYGTDYGAGYGTPGGGYAGAPPAQQPADWRLLLTPAARQLLTLFIILGALFWLVCIVGAAVAGATTNNGPPPPTFAP